MSGLASHGPLKQLAVPVLGPPCALLTAPREPLLASLLLVAQKGGCLNHYQLGKPFKQLSLLMIVTAAVLTCTVLVPPCLFQIPFVRFKDGEVGARITPAVTGHGHLSRSCPPAAAPVPGLSFPLYSVCLGRIWSQWAGRVETCLEVLWWRQ